MTDFNEQLQKLEEAVQQAVDAWNLATLNRDPVQIAETERRLIELTNELNIFKMKRVV